MASAADGIAAISDHVIGRPTRTCSGLPRRLLSAPTSSAIRQAMLTRLAAWNIGPFCPTKYNGSTVASADRIRAIGEVLPRQIVGAREPLQRKTERRGRDAARREDHD